MENPRHIAIIMDGNRRWAQQHGKLRTSGHRAGAETLDALCRAAANMGLGYLTVYAFSTENRKRSQAEVSLLLNLITEYLRRCRRISMENNIRFRSIGDRANLPETMKKEIALTESETAKNTGMLLTVAINYGGRDEIVRAVRGIVESGTAGGEVSEELISSRLDTAGIPDPDLVIRTSGEYRLSNFMLWQIAYSEFYFTDKYWPDFTAEDLLAAIEQYRGRSRRFGASGQETPAG